MAFEKLWMHYAPENNFLMKRTKKRSLILLAGIALIIFHVIAIRNVLGQRVVYATTNAVAYANGTAEFILEDATPDNVSRIYRATVPAIGVAPWWYAPELHARGGSWERLVYTFMDTEGSSCDNNILYINRTEKTAKTVKVRDENTCIQGVLDDHDVTHFIATKYGTPTQTISVGTFKDGATVASHAGPEQMALTKWAFNWELNKAALYFDQKLACSLDEDCKTAPVVYLWDLATGAWTTAKIPTYASTIDDDGTTLSYNRETNTFSLDVLLDNGIRPWNGVTVLQ